MLIDGKLLAQQILEDLGKQVAELHQTRHIQPHLGVIVVGDDAATASYVRQKKKMGEQIGGIVSVYNYPKSIKESELEENIKFLQENGELHGLIIQLPLPEQLNTEKLINMVDDDKDVDGFKETSKFNEPIAEGVIKILEYVFKEERAKKKTTITDFKQWLKSQKVVVIGKGKTGGKPIIHIMKKFDIEATIVDSKTQNPEEVTKSADILVCAVGNRGTIVTEHMIKKDAILIGIGMSLGEDGKLHGDYDPEEIKDKAAYYTPIPGGVGPVNAAMLLANVVKAAEQ